MESYTSTMSHEFRTPLGTALMFIDMILSLQLDPEAVKLITLIKSSLGLLMSLISDIVDLKLIKENQFMPTNEVFKPIKAFKFVKEMLGIQARGSQLQLSLKTV